MVNFSSILIGPFFFDFNFTKYSALPETKSGESTNSQKCLESGISEYGPRESIARVSNCDGNPNQSFFLQNEKIRTFFKNEHWCGQIMGGRLRFLPCVYSEGNLPFQFIDKFGQVWGCLLYTSPSPRDGLLSRMPSSA